jgi:hypothetical protein
MLKALKVILIVFGALSALSGLAHIFMPEQLMAMMGIEAGEMPEACMPALYAMAMVGVSFVAGGVYLIIAGTKDILRHIYWVQFALLWAILAVAAGAYSVIMGYVTFNQAMMPIILDSVFFILLMIFYPWGRTED